MLVGRSFEIFHIVRCLIYCKGTDFLLIMQIVLCFCGILLGVFVAFYLVLLRRFTWCFCGVSLGIFVAIHLVFLWHFTWCFCGVSLGVFVVFIQKQGFPWCRRIESAASGESLFFVRWRGAVWCYFCARSSKMRQHWKSPRGTWKQPFHFPPLRGSNTSPWRLR